MPAPARSEFPHYPVQKCDVLIKTPEVYVRLYTLAPGQEIPWHFHSNVTDWYFCLEGRLHVETRAPRSDQNLGPGGRAVIEQKTAHRVSNAGEGACRFLLLQGVGAYDFHRVAEAAKST